MSTSIVVDLGFGDAGKGTIVDALARRCSTPPLVVRYNGGAQAGHNVHTADGRHHTFSQFGAATFVPGSRTLLSEHMILHPSALMAENEHLLSVGVTDALKRLLIDERALVITPYQQAMNRLREFARGAAKHGTCGLGVGETVADSLDALADALRAIDLKDQTMLRQKLSRTRDRKREQYEALLSDVSLAGSDGQVAEAIVVMEAAEVFERAVERYLEIGEQLRIIDAAASDFQIRESEHVIFEGAQGVLLDEWRGFHPYTTWSTTTTRNAYTMLGRAGRMDKPRVIGVMRAYATRHGAGPFPTENQAITQQLREGDNSDTGWQGAFRAGWFDVPLTRYALSVCSYPVSELAVTCLDRLAEVPKWAICEAYSVPAESRAEFYMHGMYAASLRPGEFKDLAYQERLTGHLARCAPVLQRLPQLRGDVDRYVRALEAHLALPVTVRSMGRTAEDKRWT